MKGYEIKFKDGTSVFTDEDRGKQIFDAWMDGQKQMPFSLEENGYLIGDIKRMETYSAVTRDANLIPEKTVDYNRCRGFKSIQAQIHKRIVKEYGSEWPQAVRDQSVREEIRMELREEDKSWCDGKSGECVCPQGYRSNQRKDLK